MKKQSQDSSEATAKAMSDKTKANGLIVIGLRWFMTAD